MATTRLISEGYDVVVIDDLSTGLISNIDQQNCTFRQISITDQRALILALKGCGTNFYLAARRFFPRSV